MTKIQITRREWIAAAGVTVGGLVAGTLFRSRIRSATGGADEPVTAVATANTGATATPAMATSGATPMTVYKDPSCGCCREWVTHAQANGFTVTTQDVDDVAPIKAQHGIPADVHSCHTAIVGDYAIEGHVPADLVARVLRERPAIAGLAVPGMVVGSPGMEQGDRRDPYDVVSFTRAGAIAVYASR
jgi:hypothetical protein